MNDEIFVDAWPPPPPPFLPPPPRGRDGPPRFVGWFLEADQVIWLDQYLVGHCPFCDPPLQAVIIIPPIPAAALRELPPRSEVENSEVY